MGLLCMNANKPSIKLKSLYGKFLPGLEDEHAYEFTSFKGTERKANDLCEKILARLAEISASTSHSRSQGLLSCHSWQ